MQIPVVGPAVVGGGLGIESGLLTPITLGARATNQQTPWTQKPEVLDGSPVGEAAFNIMEILTPTLIAGAAIPGGIPGGAVGVIGESALETAIQTENNDDIIAGRSLATSIGEIAEYLYPGSGAQITEELIRGETPTSQAFTAAVGFVQNLGINITANAVVNRVTRGAAKPAKEVTEAAEASGKSEEAVQLSIDDVTVPAYRSDLEPSEAVRVADDTDVPVSRATDGNEFVNPDALTAETLRQRGLDDDFLTSGDRKYFSNIAAFSDDVKVQNMIEEQPNHSASIWSCR